MIILFSVLLLSLDAHNHVDDYSGTKKERKKKKKERKKGEKKKKKKRGKKSTFQLWSLLVSNEHIHGPVSV